MLSHPHYSVIQAYALSFYGYSSVNYYSLSLSVALISPFTLPYLLYSHRRQLSVRNQTKLLLLITGLILSCYYFSTKKRKCQVFFEFFNKNNVFFDLQYGEKKRTWLASSIASQWYSACAEWYLLRKLKGRIKYHCEAKPNNITTRRSRIISLRWSRNITLVFSADLCYNDANKKPPSGR